MKIVDANVLLYAINTDSAHHARVRAWWESALNSDQSVGLPWVVILAFLRLSTHRAAFPKPLTAKQAADKVSAWLACPVVTALSEADGHWAILQRLLAQAGTAANLTTDAHLAAIAISRDAVLVSCDNDFGRFADLRWENPLVA
jgi:toxin-antitoxin system PIN domain toxin